MIPQPPAHRAARPSVWEPATPPQTRRVPHVRSMHGEDFTDVYEWLREKDSPEILAQLEAENRYAEQVTAGLAGLRERLFAEIRSHTQETDLSVPTRQGSWWYFARTAEGKDYPIFCRVPATDSGSLHADWTPPEVPVDRALEGEEVLLDANAAAEGLPFFSLGSFQASQDGTLLTWSVDAAGDERYTQYVRDLSTGELLPDRLEGIFAGAFLTPSGRHLVYSVVDESWRPYEVRAHRLGTDPAQDRVLAHEEDPGLWLGATLTSDRTHLVLDAGCAEYNEVRLLPVAELDADRPASEGLPEPRPVISRTARVLYDVETVELEGVQHLLIDHDHGAPNGELVALPLGAARAAPDLESLRRAWTVLLPGSATRRINGMALNATHLGLSLREDALEKVAFLRHEELAEALRGRPLPAPREPEFGEELYTASLLSMSVLSPVVGLACTSFTTPERRYDWFTDIEELVLRREVPVPGGFRAEDYVARREWATAPDGTRVPLSVVHRADLDLQAGHPVVQYGYGSYEVSTDPAFSVSRLSLLDRGVVWVVAHVRGGGELGRTWYTDGKKLTKKNTFTDFVAVTEHLAAQPWADASRIAAMGGSAGGLLMGAVANLAPEKYAGILAAVPFVDPVTSISDPELPLSALEWEEWGNPITDVQVYRYMREYAPYENVAALPYPPIAAVTSLNDTRVLYVEPAKWVPALRTVSTSGQPVLLRTEMDGGHGGGSGRYKRWEDTAWEYAFLLACLGITE